MILFVCKNVSEFSSCSSFFRCLNQSIFVDVSQLKCEEKDRNQLKIDEIKRLEDALSSNIDKTSDYYMKRVTKPFHKRWNDAKMALDRYRNEDYPFIKPDDCFLIKCFKKALVAN